MRRAFYLLLTLWLLLPFFCFAEEDQELLSVRTNRALLVGCDRFLSQPDTTPSSANNIRRMEESFSTSTMDMETLVTQLHDITSSGELAALILDAFSDADEDDVSYFYLSTHGIWEEGMSAGSMTLLLSDGERESAVSAYMLRTMFDQIPGKKVLMIDACHAGAMLGKGVNERLNNVFTGDDYIVICSSGGAEESWFWSGDINGERLAGAGYFSEALVRAISSAGGFGADDNRDGIITLTELKRYLLNHHGASTVRTYPEQSDFPLFTYDISRYARYSRKSLVEGISFESDVITPDDPTVYFSFNVVSQVQVAYQLVYHRNGRWDFEHAQIIYDNNGDFASYPKAGKELPLGLTERTLNITREDASSSGYVLLQLLTIERGTPSVASSRVLCFPPESGDPLLSISMPSFFAPEDGEELTFTIHHDFPCEISISIKDMDGKTVRRICSRQGTRPEQLDPMGSSFTWDGFLTNGDIAEEGLYRIHVKVHVGSKPYEIVSEPVILLGVSG